MAQLSELKQNINYMENSQSLINDVVIQFNFHAAYMHT